MKSKYNLHKKYIGILTLALLLILEPISLAEVTMLWKATSTTYVRYEYPDPYWSDVYYGTASVREADRVKKNNMIYYYDWTQIIYDL